MKRKLLSLAAAALALAFGVSSALADAIGGAKEPIDWSGEYWGVAGGFGWGQTELHNNFGISTGDFDRHGGLLGVTGGYNWQVGSFIIGAEGDISLSTIKGTTGIACGGGCSSKLKWLGTLRGRAGYPIGKFMPYATAGLAVGEIETSVPPTIDTQTNVGWTAGAGLAYAFTTGFSAKAEYLYTDLGDTKTHIPPVTVTGKADNFQIFRIGLNFGF